MAMEFKVLNDTGGNPSWWLYSSNGQLVAWAGESFASTSNAKRAAEAFKAGAASATFYVYEDAGKKWRWYAQRSSDKVASSGESFDSKANAERAALNVQANAGSADGP
jgi:uncharacterized protein YegP (UPF0339 family)